MFRSIVRYLNPFCRNTRENEDEGVEQKPNRPNSDGVLVSLNRSECPYSEPSDDEDSETARAREAVAFLGVSSADISHQNENESPSNEARKVDVDVEMEQYLPGTRYRIGLIVMQPDGGIPHVIPLCQRQSEEGPKTNKLGNVDIYYNVTGRTIELHGCVLDKEYVV